MTQESGSDSIAQLMERLKNIKTTHYPDHDSKVTFLLAASGEIAAWPEGVEHIGRNKEVHAVTATWSGLKSLMDMYVEGKITTLKLRPAAEIGALDPDTQAPQP